MTHRSKSTLFLIEQLIVIAVFAICAVACLSILTAAYFNANDSKAASHAILRAESAAEVFKATGGDHAKTSDILGGTGGMKSQYPAIAVYYDNVWQISNEENASYVLYIAIYPTGESTGLVMSELSVEKVTGEELIAFPLAVRERQEVKRYG